MALPIITYCSLLSLHVTKTQEIKLKSIDDRAKNIVGLPLASKILSIESFKSRHACKFVRKCLDKSGCENFDGYFALLEHSKTTRNISLKLPAVRTEFARKSAFFMAAKIYNQLPTDIRKTESYSNFCQKLKDHLT